MSARYWTTIGDDEATVEIAERDGDRVRLHIDDGGGAIRTIAVDIVELDARGRVTFVDDRGEVTRVVTRRMGAHDLRVSWDRGRCDVHVIDERDAWMTAGDDAGARGEVTVSMPGRVVKVIAGEGDEVEQGQPVLIIEAMKMENEVRAPRAGVVSVVHVAEGDSVEADRVLMVVGD